MREKVWYIPPVGGGSPRLVPHTKPTGPKKRILNVNPVQLLYRAEVAPILGEIWLKSRKNDDFWPIFCHIPAPGDPPWGGTPPRPRAIGINFPPRGPPPEGGDPPPGVAASPDLSSDFELQKVAAQGPPLGAPLLGPRDPPPGPPGPPPGRGGDPPPPGPRAPLEASPRGPPGPPP